MSAADDKCTCCGNLCTRDPVEVAVTPRDADLWCLGCRDCRFDEDGKLRRSPRCPLVLAVGDGPYRDAALPNLTPLATAMVLTEAIAITIAMSSPDERTALDIRAFVASQLAEAPIEGMNPHWPKKGPLQ